MNIGGFKFPKPSRKTKRLGEMWVVPIVYPKPKGRTRDVPYMLRVKQLACCAPTAPDECSGPIEADHAGQRPVGRKADDDTCIPLCSRHHVQRTNLCGCFNGWGADLMRSWLNRMIAETRAKLRRAA